MHRTRIKICGITNPRDAVMATDAGADAIGMVFYPRAPRFISIERAREILSALPPFVTPVGLFVDSPVEQVLEIASTLRLRHLQLHGNETPQDVEALRSFGVIKAVRVAREGFAEDLNGWREAVENWNLTNLRGLVLETAGTKQPGGSGISNDWKTVAAAKANGNFDGLPPVIAAGGLTPANVANVVRDVHPWAVDVSSGVEATVGQKSKEKMEEFIRAVREADLSLK